MTFIVDDLITYVETTKRDGAADVCYRTVGRVTHIVDVPPTMLIFTPLRVFCWVDGYHWLGRFLSPKKEDAQYADRCAPLFYDTRL